PPRHTAAPSTPLVRSDRASRPDLVVLAPVGPLDPALIRELGEEGIPHLLVTAYEGRGSVGPFVLPGVTPCLVCLELTRRDRDPGDRTSTRLHSSHVKS